MNILGHVWFQFSETIFIVTIVNCRHFYWELMLQHGFWIVEDLIGVECRIISIVKMVSLRRVNNGRHCIVWNDWNFWERRKLSNHDFIWVMLLCQHVLGKFSRFVLFHILDRNLLSWINFKRLLIPYPQSLPLPYSIPIL